MLSLQHLSLFLDNSKSKNWCVAYQKSTDEHDVVTEVKTIFKSRSTLVSIERSRVTFAVTGC